MCVSQMEGHLDQWPTPTDISSAIKGPRSGTPCKIEVTASTCAQCAFASGQHKLAAACQSTSMLYTVRSVSRALLQASRVATCQNTQCMAHRELAASTVWFSLAPESPIHLAQCCMPRATP